MPDEKNIWDNSWAKHRERKPEDILNSRITKETYRAIAQFIDNDDKLILEAGCGSGRLCCLLARNFTSSQVTGTDLSENSIGLANTLKEAEGVTNVVFENGDLFEIAYPENYFDVVFNDGVIEHFALEKKPNYVDAVKEMSRVTKSGGKVIVCVPNWYCLPHTFYKWVLSVIGKPYKYGYEKSFKHNELIKLFSNVGLEEIEIGAFYPAHRWYYFAGRGGWAKVFRVLGKLTDFIEFLDFTAEKKFARKFGIDIVIKGIKK